MIGSHENGKNGGGCDGSRLAAPKSLIGLGSVAGGQSVGLLGRNLNNSNNSRVVGGQQSSVGHSQASTATSSSIGVPLLCNLRPPTLGGQHYKQTSVAFSETNVTANDSINQQLLVCPPSPPEVEAPPDRLMRATYLSGKKTSRNGGDDTGEEAPAGPAIYKTIPYVTQSGIVLDWTTHIEKLLANNDGLSLLRIYLKDGRGTVPLRQVLLPQVSGFSVQHLTLLDRIDFYFACKGYASQFSSYTRDQQNSIARSIYKKYIKKDVKLYHVLKSRQVLSTIFEQYQRNTCQFLQTTVLPGFLECSIFLNYCNELDKETYRRQDLAAQGLPRIPESEASSHPNINEAKSKETDGTGNSNTLTEDTVITPGKSREPSGNAGKSCQAEITNLCDSIVEMGKMSTADAAGSVARSRMSSEARSDIRVVVTPRAGHLDPTHPYYIPPGHAAAQQRRHTSLCGSSVTSVPAHNGGMAPPASHYPSESVRSVSGSESFSGTQGSSSMQRGGGARRSSRYPRVGGYSMKKSKLGEAQRMLLKCDQMLSDSVAQAYSGIGDVGGPPAQKIGADLSQSSVVNGTGHRAGLGVVDDKPVKNQSTKKSNQLPPQPSSRELSTRDPAKFAQVLVEKLNAVLLRSDNTAANTVARKRKVRTSRSKDTIATYSLETSFSEQPGVGPQRSFVRENKVKERSKNETIHGLEQPETASTTSKVQNSSFKIPKLPGQLGLSFLTGKKKSSSTDKSSSSKSRISEWVDTSQRATVLGQLDDLKNTLIKEAESEDTSFTEETVIIYDISTDKHPYKIKVPTNGMTMTLRQFKSCLSSSTRRKIATSQNGCRFFFKTYDKDVDGPLFVELVADSDIVPLYEGVIRAKIEQI